MRCTLASIGMDAYGKCLRASKQRRRQRGQKEEKKKQMNHSKRGCLCLGPPPRVLLLFAVFVFSSSFFPLLLHACVRLSCRCRGNPNPNYFPIWQREITPSFEKAFDDHSALSSAFLVSLVNARASRFHRRFSCGNLLGPLLAAVPSSSFFAFLLPPRPLFSPSPSACTSPTTWWPQRLA